jgi:hypothetical protein
MRSRNPVVFVFFGLLFDAVVAGAILLINRRPSPPTVETEGFVYHRW